MPTVAERIERARGREEQYAKFNPNEPRDESGRWTGGSGTPQGADDSDHASRSTHVTDTPEFKAWFGDWEHDADKSSKVVDGDGEPQETSSFGGYGSHVMRSGKPVAVYHGTALGGFDQFDKSKQHGGALFGPGFYFTEDKEVASEYVDKEQEYKLNRPLTAKDMKVADRWFGLKGTIRDALSDIGIREHWKRTYKAMKEGPEALAKSLAKEPVEDLMVKLGVHRGGLNTPEVKECYLNIRNPFDIDHPPLYGDASKEIRKMIADQYGDGQLNSEPVSYEMLLACVTEKMVLQNKDGGHEMPDVIDVRKSVTKLLQDAGYDGITHVGGYIMGNRKHQVWIAFEPHQIKSVGNRGTFDPKDDRMDYSKQSIEERIESARDRYAKHDVSGEPRDESGKWTDGGDSSGGKKTVDYLAAVAVKKGWSVKQIRAIAEKHGHDPVALRAAAAKLRHQGAKPDNVQPWHRTQWKTSIAESRHTAPDEEIGPNYETAHQRLIESGAMLDNESRSGSRYYTMSNGTKVRVADHAPNDATGRWIDNNAVAELRVDRAGIKESLDRLLDGADQMTEITDAIARGDIDSHPDYPELSHHATGEDHDEAPPVFGDAVHQSSLFNADERDPHGQKHLFDVGLSEPKSRLTPEAATPSLLEKIEDDLKSNSKANAPKQGQREMFSRRLHDAAMQAVENAAMQYARHHDAEGQKDLFTGEVRKPDKAQGKLRWITLKPHNGGGATHVQIGGDGQIHAGPASMKGKNISHLSGSHSASQKHDPIQHLRKSHGRPIGGAQIHVDKLKIDPKRFQYKISGIDQTTGTNAELKKVKQYNPMLGGQLLVWEDPNDGETYVVNGHHRYELASRSPKGEGTGFDGNMSVYYVDAHTPEEARAHGALANIAEGRGTAVDAAKFLRDTGGTIDDFEKHGVSATGAVASAALVLSKLSPHLFQKLTNGGMTEGRAASIGRYLPSHDSQDQLAQYIDRQESGKKGKQFTDGKVAEMARATAAAKPIHVNAGGGMFDDWFDANPIEQRADIADHIRKNLSSEHRVFRDASSSKRQDVLESTGENKLDVEGNRQRAGQAESAVEEFDHRVNAAGHSIALALDSFAERLFNEPKKRASILAEALKHVRGQLDGNAGADDAGGEGSGVQPLRGAGENRGHQDAGVHSPATAARFSRIRAAVNDAVMKYSGWATVGGHPGEGGQHVGGTAVHFGSDGTITKGPPALKGAKIGGGKMLPPKAPDWFKSKSAKPGDDKAKSVAKDLEKSDPTVTAAKASAKDSKKTAKAIAGKMDEASPQPTPEHHAIAKKAVAALKQSLAPVSASNWFGKGNEDLDTMPFADRLKQTLAKLQNATSAESMQAGIDRIREKMKADAAGGAAGQSGKPLTAKVPLTDAATVKAPPKPGEDIAYDEKHGVQTLASVKRSFPNLSDEEIYELYPRAVAGVQKSVPDHTTQWREKFVSDHNDYIDKIHKPLLERLNSAAKKHSRTGEVDRYLKDVTGHEHKGKGQGGGQFTSTGGGGASAPDASKTPSHQPGKAPAAHGAGPQKPPQPGKSVGDRVAQAAAANGVHVPAPKEPAPVDPAVPPALGKAIAAIGTTEQPTTAPPPGPFHAPDPSQGKASRVGVPGDALPPPPKIGLLPNLTPEERDIEGQFVAMFEADPDGMADKAIAAMQIPKGEPGSLNGDGPNVFGTDDVKMLFPRWRGTSIIGADGEPELSPETKEFRSKYNTALHQTANALAKRAFVRYLENVVAKQPEGQRNVLVTAGGVAAGKGFAIKNVPEVKSVSQAASATWDTAGEQNSTELSWVAGLCEKHGIHMTATYVHAEPTGTWENPKRGVMQRASNVGRMVDARAFADSYTHGARNYAAFHEATKNMPHVDSIILDNSRPPVPKLDANGVQMMDEDGKPATKPDVVRLDSVPESALKTDPEELYNRCMTALGSPNIPPAVKQGGGAGARIWPPPQPHDMPLHAVNKFSRVAAAESRAMRYSGERGRFS